MSSWMTPVAMWRPLSRLGRFVATVVLVTFGTTVLLDLAPGDPAVFLAGETASADTIRALNRQYGFDEPILVRYGHWLADFLQGDLGKSFVSKQPVLEAILERLPVTLELAVLTIVLALALSVPLAIAAAQRPHSALDTALGAVTSAIISIPNFVYAMVLLYFFSFRAGIFPVIGWVPLTENVGQNLRGAVLPVISIALVEAVVLYRVLRAELITTLQQDFIALARAKGLSRRAIMWKHALRPSSLSMLTLSTLSLARLLGGTVIIEVIFSLPGLGSLLVSAIHGKDLVVLQGAVAFIAVVFLVVNLVTDMLYGLLDPRTRVRS